MKTIRRSLQWSGVSGSVVLLAVAGLSLRCGSDDSPPGPSAGKGGAGGSSGATQGGEGATGGAQAGEAGALGGGAGAGGDGQIGSGGSGNAGGETSLGGGGSGGVAGLRCKPRVETRCLSVSEPTPAATQAGAASGGAASTFPHLSAMEFTNSRLNAVNSQGTIAGAALCDAGEAAGEAARAVLFEGGQVTELIAGHDEEYSEATDVNDNGMVIGQIAIALADYPLDPQTNTRTSLGFVWKDGVTTVLEDLGPARMLAVNNLDQVLIAVRDAQGRPRALLWQDGETTDLETLGGAGTVPRALNNLGHVVGLSQIAASGDPWRPFLWKDGVMSELPSIEPVDLSDTGQVLGSSTLWDGTKTVGLLPGLELGGVSGNALSDDGTWLAGRYEYAVLDQYKSQRPFVFSAGEFLPLWGEVDGQPLTGGLVRDLNGQGFVVGEGAIMKAPTPPANPSNGFDAESAVKASSHAVLWTRDCHQGCCGEPASAHGGTGGSTNE